MAKILEPNPFRILFERASPTYDRAPEELAFGSPKWLERDLAAIVGKDDVHSRTIDLVKYASDASPYRMFPKIVVTPKTISEVSSIFTYARKKAIPITIRAAGSSLSGQSQGDGILIDARKHWTGSTVEDGGKRLRVRPGTIVFRANLALKPFGYRLGPDPASSGVATVGGVIANNSSGMCCGTFQNSYKTLESISFLLPSGTHIDSAKPDAERIFAESEPALTRGLLAIKNAIESDQQLVATIKKKYSIKNTTGYHMEAFIDASTPLEIFRKLLVGSEGTLGFISEAVFQTVADKKFRSAALLLFEDLHSACAAVANFTGLGAAAVELCDRQCLRAVEGKPGVPTHWRTLPERCAALLVEFREPTLKHLENAQKSADVVIRDLRLLEEAAFTSDPEKVEQYWAVRHGLLASIGGTRIRGTSLILEDVCFPPEVLAEGALELQRIFEKHHYAGVIFGHASSGNLHFLITPSLNSESEIERFDAFMEDVVSVVSDQYGGSLKAEHGTGRNIAPFVEREWGTKLTELMWRVKELADPDQILSPGVVLTRDKKAHLRHLHTLPAVQEGVDRCIECGYCEPVCPSRNLTTTPRQRIVLLREMARQQSGSKVTKALLEEYQYQAIETCAGDATCAIACPVNIDTGNLMKQFRHQEHSRAQELVAYGIARNWKVAEMLARNALRANRVVASLPGSSFIAESAFKVLRTVISTDVVPAWRPNLPAAATSKLPRTSRSEAAAVYFNACVNRIFGGGPVPLVDALVKVSERAGLNLWLPDDLAGSCCATVWQSKGYKEAGAYTANRIVSDLWEWTRGGELPVVCDASSCTHGIRSEVIKHLSPTNAERHNKLQIIDSVEWAWGFLLPNLKITQKVGTVRLHPACSLRHLDAVEEFESLAKALANEVVMPIHATCCGFAGDRGFLHPELTASATAEQVEELKDHTFDRYLGSNRTCDIGMTHATGQEYESIVILLEELTR